MLAARRRKKMVYELLCDDPGEGHKGAKKGKPVTSVCERRYLIPT